MFGIACLEAGSPLCGCKCFCGVSVSRPCLALDCAAFLLLMLLLLRDVPLFLSCLVVRQTGLACWRQPRRPCNIHPTRGARSSCLSGSLARRSLCLSSSLTPSYGFIAPRTTCLWCSSGHAVCGASAQKSTILWLDLRISRIAGPYSLTVFNRPAPANQYCRLLPCSTPVAPSHMA